MRGGWPKMERRWVDGCKGKSTGLRIPRRCRCVSSHFDLRAQEWLCVREIERHDSTVWSLYLEELQISGRYQALQARILQHGRAGLRLDRRLGGGSWCAEGNRESSTSPTLADTAYGTQQRGGNVVFRARESSRAIWLELRFKSSLRKHRPKPCRTDASLADFHVDRDNWALTSALCRAGDNPNWRSLAGSPPPVFNCGSQNPELAARRNRKRHAHSCRTCVGESE